MTHKLSMLLMATAITASGYAYGAPKMTTLNVTNNTSKNLTVKVMPNDELLDSAIATAGATIKAGQNVMNALEVAGSRKRKSQSEIGLLDTVKILPKRTAYIRVPAKVNAIGGERIIEQVRVTGSHSGLTKPGRCSGIPLDGIEKDIAFKSHKTIGGVKCVKTYKE